MPVNALATLATVATEPIHRTSREAIAPQPALVLKSASPSSTKSSTSQSMKQQVVRATAVDASATYETRPAILPATQVNPPPMEQVAAPHHGKVRTSSQMMQSHSGQSTHQTPRQVSHKYQRTSIETRSPASNQDPVPVPSMTPSMQATPSRRTFPQGPPIHPPQTTSQIPPPPHMVAGPPHMGPPMTPPMNHQLSHQMQPVYYSPMPVSYGPPQPTMMMTPNGPMMMVSGPPPPPMNQMMPSPTMIQVPVHQAPPAPYGYQYVSHMPGPPPTMQPMQPMHQQMHQPMHQPMQPMHQQMHQQVQYVQAPPQQPHMVPPQGMVPVHYAPHPQYVVQ